MRVIWCHVGKQLPQTLAGRMASGDEFPAFFLWHVGAGNECLKAYLHRRYGGFQFVVDVVGELTLDPYFFLLLVKGGTVFAVTVGHGLLQTCVQPHDMVGYVAEFVMGKWFGVVDAFAAFGFFGKTVQPGYVDSYTAGGEKAQYAHNQSNACHEPKERVVRPTGYRQGSGIGHCGTYYEPVRPFWRSRNRIVRCWRCDGGR